MSNKRNYRSLDDAEISYFKEHPDEISDYIQVAFEEFSEDNNIGALLSQLRIAAQVVGFPYLEKQTGLTRNGIQKLLSHTGNPSFMNMLAVLSAFGFDIKPTKKQVA